MDQKHWIQIEELLQQALDLPRSQRAAFLDEHCAGDDTLLAEVKALLDRETQADRFMESPAAAHLLSTVNEPPSRISHYRIENQIGVGGMGQIYKAQDETLGRLVALKMLPVAFTSDSERVRRFRQEALAASRLNHPNIITIFEIVHQDSNHFIAEEYVEGKTLRELLTDPQSQKQRSLSLERSLEIAIQIARALKAAHTAWIIHRDIKPENIMIREDGLVKVVDFGIAKLGDESDSTSTASATFQSNDPSLTVPGLIMGTASYMSPEQARGEPLDGRTDLFSLGILLYEMVAGARLLAGATPQSVKLDRIPKELQRILRRVLQSDREERYSSAGELLDDLLAFKQRRESRITRRLVGVSAFVVVVAFAVVAIAAFLSVNETWEEKIFRAGHTAAVRRAVFSPDGKMLISVGEDHQVIVWDFLRRMPLKTISEHTGVINTVAFSPDGKWFITGDEQQTAIIWNVARLEPETVWRDQRGSITASRFSPDGRVLIYSAGDISIVRETGTWKKLRELPFGVAFGDFLFPKGSRVVEESQGRVWDLNTGAPLASFPSDWGGNWAALSPDSKTFVSVGAQGDVTFVDQTTRQLLHQEHVHHDHGRAVAYSPDGKLLATGAERVVLWDAVSMRRLVPLEYESVVWSVAFSPDGRWLISTHGDGSILIWDVINRELAANLKEHSGGVRGVAFSRDGSKLATASEDHSVIVWDVVTGRKEAVLTDHETRVAAVAFSPDGRWFASADQMGVVITHNFDDQSRLVIPPSSQMSSYCVVISPDSRFLVTSFVIYDAKTGEAVVPYGCPPWGHVYSAAFTPGGELLIGGTDKGEVVIVETATWREIARQRWTDAIVSLSISPDGNYLVTGDDARKVRFGTIKPLKQLGVLGEHDARVKAVAFSPDGKRVASAGDDKVVALWDVDRRKLLTTIGTHTSPIYALAFSPDGRRLITGEHDRSVRQYTRHRTLWGFSLE